MPRAKNPQTAVLEYFEHVPVGEAEHTLIFIKHILSRRKAEVAAPTTANLPVAPKPRKARTPRTRRASTTAPDGTPVPPPSGL